MVIENDMVLVGLSLNSLSLNSLCFPESTTLPPSYLFLFFFFFPPSSLSSLVRLAGGFLCRCHMSGGRWISSSFDGHAPHGWSQMAPIYTVRCLRCNRDDVCRFTNPRGTRGSHAPTTLVEADGLSASHDLSLFSGLAFSAPDLPYRLWTSSDSHHAQPLPPTSPVKLWPPTNLLGLVHCLC